MTRYDEIGHGYTQRRRPDPRIEAQILAALGDARTVVNVGAGTGSYEPPGRFVVAIEPSTVMIEQRAVGSAPVLRGAAEALPFPDEQFDAATAFFTVHHWVHYERGLREMCRVARRQVILTWEPSFLSDFWPFGDYFPDLLDVMQSETAISEVLAVVNDTRPDREVAIESILVPHDCTDGFFGAYWRRPEAFLAPDVRASISGLALHAEEIVRPGLERLAADLDSGEWHRRHAELLDRETLDLGYRLVTVG